MPYPQQLDHDFNQFQRHFEVFRSHFTDCKLASFPATQTEFRKTHLEIGAGTGLFFSTLAKLFPEERFIAIERDRMRGKALERKSKKLGLPNFLGLRGNAMPAIFHGLSSASIDSVFILYPCPWPKFSQRKNRWYFHAIMPDLIRVLKPGGLLVWASDQEFYIQEAEYICRTKYPLEVLEHGPLQANAMNYLEHFPEGRSKFEKAFRSEGKPSFELILRRSDPTPAPE